MATQINGLENISVEQLNQELAQGGKFVIFYYCISILVLTFKQPSAIYYIRPGESTASKSLPFTLLSLVMGWWGFPFGPIYTIAALATNFGGGKNITAEVIRSMNSPAPGAPPAN